MGPPPLASACAALVVLAIPFWHQLNMKLFTAANVNVGRLDLNADALLSGALVALGARTARGRQIIGRAAEHANTLLVISLCFRRLRWLIAGSSRSTAHLGSPGGFRGADHLGDQCARGRRRRPQRALGSLRGAAFIQFVPVAATVAVDEDLGPELSLVRVLAVKPHLRLHRRAR